MPTSSAQAIALHCMKLCVLSYTVLLLPTVQLGGNWQTHMHGHAFAYITFGIHTYIWSMLLVYL